MNWDAVGAIGEIIGAIAVVVTLVYLATQVRHARREQQVAAIRANRIERREFFELARDSAYLPAILCKVEAGEPLTPEEDRRLLYHNAANWGLLYSEWVQERLGLSGEYATSVQANIAFVLTQPGALDWFQQYGIRLYPDRFGSDVDRVRQQLESP